MPLSLWEDPAQIFTMQGLIVQDWVNDTRLKFNPV
jgi:hypothetical protein